MAVWAVVADIILGNSEAAAIALLGGYLAYEIRFGVMQEVRSDQRIIGIGLYRVFERNPDLDEEEFRDALWGSDNKNLLADDLLAGSGPDPPGDD